MKGQCAVQGCDGAAGGAREQHLPARHAGGRGRGRRRDRDGPQEAAQAPAPETGRQRCGAPASSPSWSSHSSCTRHSMPCMMSVSVRGIIFASRMGKSLQGRPSCLPTGCTSFVAWHLASAWLSPEDLAHQMSRAPGTWSGKTY